MSDGTNEPRSTAATIPNQITTASGGVVRFRDLDASPLTGRDIKKWRQLYNITLRGDHTQRSIELLFEMFVTGWEFTALPRLPLPSEDIGSIDLLPADDQFDIEDALEPMIDELNGYAAKKRRNAGTGPGSPTRPSSD